VNALHPRVRIVWGLRVAVSAAVLGALAAGAALLLERTPLVGAAVFAVSLLFGLVYTVLKYRRWGYEVQEDALALERGVFTVVDSSVPYVRVQHVDTQRGPIERVVGLSSVVVYTAGNRGADVSVPGLDPERANDLHDRLRRLAVESEPEDGV
jgi:membrane protein YdbS with pleckstrin-like domain